MKKYIHKLKLAVAVVSTVSILALTSCADGTYSDSDMVNNDTTKSYSYSKGVKGSPTFIGNNGRTSEDVRTANQYYFAFDRSTLDPEALAEIRKHARYLLENPNAKVRVEGHTDERGSREYNVALGERRAQSVSKALTNEGVLDNQVAVVSYGEEKPSVLGHDENAWKWNRRAKIVYELG